MKFWQLLRKKKENIALEKEKDRFRNPRLKQIEGVMKERKVKGNPKDYVLIINANVLIDGSGNFEIKATLPEKLNPGNHVWYNYCKKGKYKIQKMIVLEDRKTNLLVRDEKNIFTWDVNKDEVSPLPIPRGVQLVHKKKLPGMLGKTMGNRFWNKALNKRKIRP